MLIYSHATPEILIASFRNKTQVKNSTFCGLIDDNFPDDVMSLTGDDLVIKESKGTLNIDIALAIAFNAMRDCDTARQFAKIYIANGSNIDTRTLMYYKNRILNGPFGPCVKEYIQANFEAAREGDTGVNDVNTQRNLGGNNIRNNFTKENYEETIGANELIDKDFVGLLKKTAGDCLNAPCDYFSHGGSFGFLTNGGIPNVTTTPGMSNSIAPPIDDRETFNKLPPLFQKGSLMLSELGNNTMGKLKNVFTDKTQKQQEEQILNKQTITAATPQAVPPPSSSGVLGVIKSNLSSFLAFAKANTQVQNVMSANLGDCFRMNDYRQRYNPFSYMADGGMNGEIAAPPGISGMAVGTRQQNNGALNAEAPNLPTGDGGLDPTNPLLPPINN